MIKANINIIVGGKTFQAGQTVSGLSKLDKSWMSEAGYITETAGKKEAGKMPVPEDVTEEETVDEQL
ncbi:MAG: hypothetical protein NC517_12050 [Firmicutes bacterium]|nr:hypothetical protein [Bacillota bacterium]